jgi:hypothetical protein
MGNSKEEPIKVYYFHFTVRCVTCKTVEEQTKNNVQILYPGEVKQGTISFQSVNLDEPAGKALGEKLKVSGQTVLLVKGNQKTNLTNEGFLYAVTNPDKFKSIMKTKIDHLLAQ